MPHQRTKQLDSRVLLEHRGRRSGTVFVTPLL